jgi:cytochrome c
MRSTILEAPNHPVSYWFLVAACVALVPHVVSAAPPSAASDGHKLAQRYCAVCHVIAPSPVRGWTDAPSFEAVANRKGTTTRALSTFIQHPHMDMENTGRPPGEANDIAAYIFSLRKN